MFKLLVVTITSNKVNLLHVPAPSYLKLRSMYLVEVHLGCT